MTINGNTFSDGTAEELIHGHVGHFALDVPQSYIHTGDGIVFNAAVAPVGILVHKLPQLLNVLDIATYKQRL